jgi:uncharacterized protein HemX
MRAIVVILGLSGCWYAGTLGAGTKRPDFGNQRDPNPMLDPNRNLTENMWSPSPEKGEAPKHGRRGKPTNASRLGGVIAAALAYGVAGWSPLVQVQGEFEEDPDQAARYRAEDAAADADEQQRTKPKIEQAPAAADPAPAPAPAPAP